MIAASVETVSAFLHEVRSGSRALITLSVWNALGAYVRQDTGEIACTRRTVAKTAGVSFGDAQRAMTRLVEIGVLRKEARGRYVVNPSVMWKGQLSLREAAEAKTHPFTVLDGGKAET
jgi:predicted transcriptional regulator of viral defense system